MKKIAWITDTAAQLDKAFIQQHNVYILPLSVCMGVHAGEGTIGLSRVTY